MLTDKEVQEFKKITKETMGIDLTNADARNQGGRLVTLFELLIKIDRRNKQEKHEEDKIS